MYRRILPLLIFGFFIITYADLAVQTDWSGGAGLMGPVTLWADQFYTCSNVDYYSNIGSVSILYGVLPAAVQHDIAAPDMRDICTADVDGDGDDDVLGVSGYNDDISWWEYVGGTDESWIKHTVDSTFDNPTNLFASDLDGDGDIDILACSFYYDKISWWENVDGIGTLWLEHMVDDSFDGVYSVCASDVDGDGDTDILGSSYYSDEITWWENADGSGISWIEFTIDSNFNGPRGIFACDIDGDGDIDVIGAAYIGNDIAWWENVDGSGISWTLHWIDYSFGGAWSVYSSDVDGDGDMDVLGTARTEDKISWWENADGSGTSWIEHVVAEAYNGAISVYAIDIDGDGDTDIVGSAIPNLYYGYMNWWENTSGTGESWENHYIGFGLLYDNAYASDVDADGDIDVLATVPGPNGIFWWEVVGYSCEGSLESSILDTQMNPEWDYLDWNSQTLPGTAVSFQVRASDDHTAMGVWSDTLTSACSLAGILNDGDSYVQYRVILETSNPDSTPTLNDVTITWSLLGLLDDPQVSEYLLYGAEPNPSSGSVSIYFAIPELSQVELSVYDLTGRLVISPSHGEYSPGVQQVQLGEFTPGIYFCRMISGEFTATQSFVVIE